MSKILTATDRSALIRLASTMVVGSPERRAILRMADKAKTPAGAKKLHKRYLDGLKDPSKSKKSPKDFYDKEEGEDEAETKPTMWDSSALSEHGKKKKKEKTKAEKGREKTKERTQQSEEDQETARPKHYRNNRFKDRLDAMRGNVTKGRDKAKKELADMSPEQLRKKVHKIIRENKLDPDVPGDLNKALQGVQGGIDDIESRLKGQHPERTYADSYEKDDIASGYDQALLSKYKKQKGDKGEKAKRTTKVNEKAKKHGLDADDVDKIRGLAKGWKKKQSDKAISEMKDEEWLEYHEARGSYSMSHFTDEDMDRFDEIESRLNPDGGPTKAQRLDKQKQEFLKNADPEMKKRIKDMDPADFAEMLAAIMDEEDVGGGKKASDRSALIRLASTMVVGSPERKVLLAGLSR